MEAVAIHTFRPTEEDELGFEKGSLLYIVEMEEDPNWYKARQGQREGMVPANYITLTSHPWYIPHCSRREAEARLLEVDSQTRTEVQPDGAFILRQSDNQVGPFSLSVKDGSTVLHFRVFFKPPCNYHIWNNCFRSINELIEYHRHQTIYGDKILLLRDCLPSKRFGLVGMGHHIRSKHVSSPKNRSKSQPHNGDHKSAPVASVTSNPQNRTTPDYPPEVTSTHLAGRHCVAKFDFSAEFESELSFRRGDRIHILGEEDDNWWYGELVSTQHDHQVMKRGMIPANYVHLLPEEGSSSRNLHRNKVTPVHRSN